MPKESELDRAFADSVASSESLQQRLLAQALFFQSAGSARLLKAEQAAAGPKVSPKNWWPHWSCELGDMKGSETDILLVFERRESSERFAMRRVEPLAGTRA